MSIERAADLAEGRVWVGTDALDLGLVDALGGLEPAVAAAARQAGLDEGEFEIKYIEQPLTLRDRLFLAFAVNATGLVRALGLHVDTRTKDLLARILGSVENEIRLLANLNDPRGLYYHCFCQLP